MEIFEKLVLDQVQIVAHASVIQVRCKKQKWVRNGDQEMLIEPSGGFHRYTLSPGDWDLADQLNVRSYAEIVWTPEVIQEYQANVARRSSDENVQQNAVPNLST